MLLSRCRNRAAPALLLTLALLVSQSALTAPSESAARVSKPSAARNGSALAFGAAAQALPRDAALADLALYREGYERIHPGYDRYTSRRELDAAWNAFEAGVGAAPSIPLGEFYLGLQRVLVQIRCDHTKAGLPSVLVDDRESRPVYLPFRWRVVEGRGFVTGVPEGSPLTPRDELLAIDGVALTERMAAVAPFIPIDGFTDWARAGGIAQSLEFRGGAVDHFGTLLWGAAPIVDITVRSPDGEAHTHQLQRLTYGAYRAVKEPDAPARNFDEAVTFERLGDDAAYLRVDTFVNYRRPVDPETIYEPIFRALANEARGALILDLRRNGGGSDDAANALVSYLIREPLRPVRESRVATVDHEGLVPYLSTWDTRAIDPPRLAFRANDDGSYTLRSFFDDARDVIEPARSAFTGRLILLTSRNNSSGSTHLLGALAQRPGVTLVGERTGGAPNGATAGVILTLTAPNSGIPARIPFLRAYRDIEPYEEGVGLTPDVRVDATVEAYLSGRDEALFRAIELAGRRE